MANTKWQSILSFSSGRFLDILYIQINALLDIKGSALIDVGPSGGYMLILDNEKIWIIKVELL